MKENDKDIEDVYISNNTTLQELEEKEEKKKKRKMGIELVIYVFVLFLCAFLVPKYILQRTIIEGPSMENNLYNGENVLVEKVSVHFKELDRFDIIVFYPYGKDSTEYYVKRVIGLPGETIQIKMGEDDTYKIYINNAVLEENYGKNPITFGGIAEEPIELGEDEYFVLGDNRAISKDSRDDSVGVLNKKNIGGKVILRIWPFSKFGTID